MMDLPHHTNERSSHKREASRETTLATRKQSLASALSGFVFGVGKNDSRLVGRLLSVSQPEFHELTQHEA